MGAPSDSARGREHDDVDGHDHDHAHGHDHAHDHAHGHDHAHHGQDHHGDEPHDHPSDPRADGALFEQGPAAKTASKLPWVLVVAFSFFVVELMAARYARSDVLRADAIHLLADVLAIGIAYAAFRLADRRPTARFTFGLRRIEAVAAAVNALLVMGGAAEIVHEGLSSIRTPEAPKTGVMMAVAIAALVVHGLNATLLHRDIHGHGHGGGHAHHSHASPHVHVGAPSTGRMSVRGAFLHVLGDALGACAALVAGLSIRMGAPHWVDPVASFFVALLLVVGGLRLLRDAGLVLLEAAPPHLPIERIAETVCAVDGVDCVHRMRVWSLGTGYDAIALHVTASGHDCTGLAERVGDRLRERFHLDYVCVQVDAKDHDGH